MLHLIGDTALYRPIIRTGFIIIINRTALETDLRLSAITMLGYSAEIFVTSSTADYVI